MPQQIKNNMDSDKTQAESVQMLFFEAREFNSKLSMKMGTILGRENQSYKHHILCYEAS